MPDINKMAARSGKVLNSNSEVRNEADGINPDGSRNVQLTGSKAILKGEPFPDSTKYDTVLEYDVATKDTKVYKFISGDWREL